MSRGALLKQTLKKSGLFAVGNIVMRGPDVALLPLYAAFLPTSDYGIIGIAAAVTSVLRPVLSLGLRAAAVKFYYDFDDEDERRAFYGGLWLFYLVGTGSLYVTLDLVGPWLFGNLFTQIPYHPVVRLAVWTAFIDAAFLDIPRQILKASSRPGAFSGLNTGLYGLIIGLTVWFVGIQEQGAEGAVFATFLSTVIVSAICAIFLLRYVRWPRRGHGAHVYRAVVFSLPMAPHFVAHWVLSASDRIMLERHVSLSELGIYSAGYTIGWGLSLLRVAFAQSMIPLYGNLSPDASVEERRPIAHMITYTLGALAVAGMVVVVFKGELVALVTPPQYQSAAAIVPWIVLGAFCFGIYNPSVQVLNLVLGATKLVGISTLVAAVLKIVLNLIFIPTYGLTAAAVGTAVTYFVVSFGVFAIVQARFPMPYEYRRLGLIVASTGVPAVISLMLPDMSAVWMYTVKGLLVLSPLIGLHFGGFFEADELAFFKRTMKAAGQMRKRPGVGGE